MNQQSAGCALRVERVSHKGDGVGIDCPATRFGERACPGRVIPRRNVLSVFFFLFQLVTCWRLHTNFEVKYCEHMRPTSSSTTRRWQGSFSVESHVRIGASWGHVSTWLRVRANALARLTPAAGHHHAPLQARVLARA